MDFKLNFSTLHAEDLQRNKVSIQEITFVYQGNIRHTVWQPVNMPERGIYYYLIGFTYKQRFLQILLHCDGVEVHFLQVKVADDIEIIIEDFFQKL